jgi:DNA-binding NarL/FixJ family response regulator
MRALPGGELFGDGLRKEVKLLVVDDHDDHFEHLKAFAEMYSAGFQVECKLASEPEEAHSLVDSWHPSVVLVDVHLAASSLGLIKDLTARGTTVVALSEIRIPELVETSQNYGAVGYFTKSDNPDDIEALISYIASISDSGPLSH